MTVPALSRVDLIEQVFWCQAMSVEVLSSLRGRLDALEAADSPAGLIDQIQGLEELLAITAAKQVALTVAFDTARRAQEARAGTPSERQGRGVAAEIALARRSSPANARRFVGWARILTGELPATYAALKAGRTTVWRTMLLARETACLSRADRARVDAELGPKLEGFGDRQVESETRRAAYRLDPHAALARSAAAAKDRRVSLRPAPDTMTWLSALLPVEQGVAAYAALSRAADTGTAVGDGRNQGQLMADTLVERITGQTTAGQVPVQVHVLTGPHTLSGGQEPGTVVGYGLVPAGLVRDLARRTTTTLRPVRLDEPIASSARTFTSAQWRIITLRDLSCRTPWCDAPIRHIDHITAHTSGGPTHTSNGQGLCEACNHAEQAGFDARPEPVGTVTITTPTGTPTHRPPTGSTPHPSARHPTRTRPPHTLVPGRGDLDPPRRGVNASPWLSRGRGGTRCADW